MSWKEKCTVAALLIAGVGCGGGGRSSTTTSDVCPISQTTVETDSAVSFGSTSMGGTGIAQSVAIPAGSNLVASKIKLGLMRQGYPTGRLTLRLESDNGDSPSGVDVSATSTVTLDYTSNGLTSTSTLKETNDWYTFTFSAAVTLVASTRYWIHVVTSAALNASTYVLWSGSNAGGFTTGRAVYESSPLSGTIFTDAAITSNRDMVFAICK